MNRNNQINTILLNPVEPSDEFLSYDLHCGVVKIYLSDFSKEILNTYVEATKCINKHLENHDRLHVHISIHVFDTYLVKILVDIFNTLNRRWKQGKDISVSWFLIDGQEEINELAHYMVEIFDFQIDLLTL